MHIYDYIIPCWVVLNLIFGSSETANYGRRSRLNCWRNVSACKNLFMPSSVRNKSTRRNMCVPARGINYFKAGSPIGEDEEIKVLSGIYGPSKYF